MKETFKKVVCKTTKKEFYDVENKSGVLTNHLNSLGISVPTAYKRRNYFKQHNKKWHLNFFDLAEEVLEIKKCKYCDWKTFDLNNVSGAYTTHLKEKHNIDIDNYLIDYPNESILFKTHLDKKTNLEITLQENNHVHCKICNKKLRVISCTHLKKHNMTPDEYKSKFGHEDFISINSLEKMRNVLITATTMIEKSFVSKGEKAVGDFINSIGLETVNNNRKIFEGMEIDIIVPENSICFEFNGNLYHSEVYGKKNRYFHLNKTEKCNKKGYDLYHIQEDEWEFKKDIVQSKIRYALNKSNIINSKDCEFKFITFKEKNDFLYFNDIEGRDRSSIFVGCFYDEELVSVCTFKKPKGSDFKISRFCEKNNFKIEGVLLMFIKFMCDNFKIDKVVSSLDIRWNPNQNKNIYVENGFNLFKIVPPIFSYFNKSRAYKIKRLNRFNYNKYIIRDKFPHVYNENKTEWQMMQELKFDRIWDCGKYFFLLTLQKN